MAILLLRFVFVISAVPYEVGEETSTKSAPVGPVAGGIMGCFLMLALGVYCYRHRVHRNSLQYISTLPENPNRHSQFYETDDIDPVEDSGNGKLYTLSISPGHHFT